MYLYQPASQTFIEYIIKLKETFNEALHWGKKIV